MTSEQEPPQVYTCEFTLPNEPGIGLFVVPNPPPGKAVIFLIHVSDDGEEPAIIGAGIGDTEEEATFACFADVKNRIEPDDWAWLMRAVGDWKPRVN